MFVTKKNHLERPPFGLLLSEIA